MIPYISLSALVSLCAINNYRYVNYLFIIIVSIFIGARDGVGADYYNYELLYSSIKSSSYNVNFEPGYFFLAKISPNFLILNFLVSLISVSLIYSSCRKLGVNNFLFWFFFLISDLFLAHFNIVRQVLAFSIILYAVSFLVEGKNIKYCILSILAICFHYSAGFVFVIVYFFWFFKKHSFFIFIFFILLLFVWLVGAKEYFNDLLTLFLPEKYDSYIGMVESKNTSSGTRFYAELIIASTLFLFNLKERVISFLLITYIFGLILTIFAMDFQMLFRFSYYFVFYKVAVLPGIYVRSCFDFNSTLLITFTLALFYLLAFFVMLSSNTFGVVPYNWGF